MFAKWLLKRNPFTLDPISLETLEWFVGRDAELALCSKLLLSKSLLIVEGGLGVGTTSFANKVRFSSPLRSPRIELAAYRDWTAQSLLENVLVAIVNALSDEAVTGPVIDKWRPFVERVERSLHGGGVSVMSLGASYTQGVTIAPPLLLPIETLRQALIELAGALPVDGAEASFVIQLNNLDIDETFPADRLRIFLNDARDAMQLPGLDWILVGKTGLCSFIRNDVPRVASIVTHEVRLDPLTLDEVVEAVDRRVEACSLPGKRGRNPISRRLLTAMYDLTGGSLREIFHLCGKLCVATAMTPLAGEVDEVIAAKVFAELLSAKFAWIHGSNVRERIVRAIAAAPGTTQRDVIKSTGIGQTAVSRAVRELVSAGLMASRRSGRRILYHVTADVALAASVVWPSNMGNFAE